MALLAKACFIHIMCFIFLQSLGFYLPVLLTHLLAFPVLDFVVGLYNLSFMMKSPQSNIHLFYLLSLKNLLVKLCWVCLENSIHLSWVSFVSSYKELFVCATAWVDHNARHAHNTIQNKLGLYWAKLSSNWNWNLLLLYSKLVESNL